VFVIPGVEITHAPPSQIEELVVEARNMGIVLVIVHGESPVEPVMSGTNRAAIISGADILAHPGLISEEDAGLARDKHVFLEITCRSGHSLTNGHVFRMAAESGAQMVISTDTHSPENLVTYEKAETVLRGAGMNSLGSAKVFDSNQKLLEILKARMDW
jgi:histidinol phosphatase-like PHP family hydrolase